MDSRAKVKCLKFTQRWRPQEEEQEEKGEEGEERKRIWASAEETMFSGLNVGLTLVQPVAETIEDDVFFA